MRICDVSKLSEENKTLDAGTHARQTRDSHGKKVRNSCT
ncbi:hypothetical protein E2C01_039175 [Portunus trituberculatus]|uniref:Uncharacterized protein n=1 Tax=Portunus trituberculatus TaxID=210409 RepID=A0A5B7FJ59_PORTR|nr:hypothetical protein [Portunus trituberculatus]